MVIVFLPGDCRQKSCTGWLAHFGEIVCLCGTSLLQKLLSVALQFFVKAWPLEDHWGKRAAQENLLSGGQWEEEKGTHMWGNTLMKKAERQGYALSMELT